MPTPLFNWLDKRATGVLLHPTSLPSNQGIGCFGPEAYRFVDFLLEGGISHWQICPLGPTGFGDSPYQCFSAFAGNPYLIDLQPLVEFGLLKETELEPLSALPHDHVDYGELYEAFWPILAKAAKRFAKGGEPTLDGYGRYKNFLKEHAHWLDAYAAYRATKEHFKGKPWVEWPKKCRTYADWQKSDLPEKLKTDIAAEKFYQYVFFGQWTRLREYANNRGVSIIGDVPIFVALDSADTWSNLEVFQLTKEAKPKAVAGVPPDYFSATGQLWGNPLFDWETLKARNYDWWMDRLKATFTLYDVVRIDHFRAFHDYWSIPATAKDATEGEWKPGPGIDFFEAVKKEIPEAHLIAEDLGDLNDGVHELRQKTGLPGMAVLQFAFGGDASNDYLPHNHTRNSVVYAGTHDNNTTLGWYWEEGDHIREHVRRYFGISDEAPQWDFIRACYRSTANLAVITMQDMLNKGAESRMNAPGSAQGNWSWRFSPEDIEFLQREVAGYLKEIGYLYGRIRD